MIDSEGGEGDDFHFQDSDEELSEPDETANGNDVLGEQVQNSPTEIGLDVSAELSDDHVEDAIILSSDEEDEEPNDQRASGNVLEEQNNETDRDLSTALSDDRVQDTNLIILSSDEEDDGPDSELVAETSTVGNVTLKLVYNVEYKEPY